ncbi:hypothetical protein D3C77_263580 [compost metagenome]
MFALANLFIGLVAVDCSNDGQPIAGLNAKGASGLEGSVKQIDIVARLQADVLVRLQLAAEMLAVGPSAFAVVGLSGNEPPLLFTMFTFAIQRFAHLGIEGQVFSGVGLDVLTFDCNRSQSKVISGVDGHSALLAVQ